VALDGGVNAILPERARGALADAVGADAVTTDRDLLASRETDWRGRRLGAAAALVRPASLGQAQAVVRVARDHGLVLVPQGGQTGLVGGGLPPPGSARPVVLVGMERMAAIRAIDPQARVLFAEAGVVLDHVHAAARDAGLRFPLTLAARGSATVGGLVSTNAGGTQVLRHGTMRARVLGLEAVLPDGTALHQLQPMRKDNAGMDARQLLVGAEGTLGIVTAAALALAPLLAARTVAWVGLASPEAALALLAALPPVVEGFELIPADGLDLVLRHVPAARAPLAHRHPWHALIEVEAEADVLADAIAAAGIEAVIAQSGAQAEALWALREALPEAERRDGPAIKHDIALPVADVPAFLAHVTPEVEAAAPGGRVLAFGHLGDGNLHFNMRAPAGAGPEWLAVHAAPVTRLVHDRVAAAGGSIAAEHGVGWFKRDELARLGDPGRLAVMRAVKQALDPDGLMNPGKLLP
jgi:FAD/FMN-containing dehydrogenase